MNIYNKLNSNSWNINVALASEADKVGMQPNITVKQSLLLLHVHMVSVSNLNTGYSDSGYPVLSPSRQMSVKYLRLGHDSFHPQPL